MIYKITLSKVIHKRNSLSYRKEPIASVLVSDYTVNKCGDYPHAAFSRRPDLVGLVSSYEVQELIEKSGQLSTGQYFMCGNDHSGCRRFYE